MIWEVIDRVVHDTSGLFSQGDVTDSPCPAITVGVDSLNARHYQVYSHMTDALPESPPRDPSKPPYRVPSMAEIRAIPPSGYVAASTFSGCGGSSLGYRMQGFRVAWASEFVQAARECYLANCDPGTVLDARDIRDVRPEEVLAAIGVSEGDLDLLDGSPPCASFSTSGKREKGWGQTKKYSDTSQRTDDLFFEFARLLRGIRPRVFVAENVSGLAKGKAKGYFLEILAALKACGYRVEARILDAQWLGVPQSRQRLIFVGVREDLRGEPRHPAPLPYRYSVRDAIPWVRAASAKPHGPKSWANDALGADAPAPTVPASGDGGASYYRHEVEVDSSIEGYAIGQEWDRLAVGETSERYYNLVRVDPERPCPTATQTAGQSDAAGITHPFEKRKFTIAELRRICGFPDDFTLTGTYAQQWERLGRAVPPVMMSHVAREVRRILDEDRRL